MRLGDYQIPAVVSAYCTPDELEKLPTPSYVLDFQTGTLCAEFPRTSENLVALRIAGLSLEN